MTRKFYRYLINLSVGFSFVAMALGLSSQTASAQYCTTGLYTSSACTIGDGMNNFVTTGGITNISNMGSGCASGFAGYSNYTTQSASQIQGLTLSFSIDPLGSWTEGCKIWVDWNDDGDFVDAGEQVWASAGYSTTGFSGTFTIPVAAPVGPHRMRVRMVWFSTTFTSCSAEYDGEVEDYTLTVISACPTKPTVTAGAVTNPVCIGDTLKLLSTSSIAGSSFAWTGPGGFTSSTQNPMLPNMTAAMAGTYKVIVTEPTNGCVDSATVTITTNPRPTSATISFVSSSICIGSSLTVGASAPVGGIGPFTYSWSASSTGSPVIGTTGTITYTPPSVGADTLFVTITNGYGCKNTFPAYYTVNPTYNITVDDTVCSDVDLTVTPYFFAGFPIFTTGIGIASATVTSSTGCDSTMTLNLHLRMVDTTILYDTVCDNTLPYTWVGGTMTGAGTDYYSVMGSDGCDSYSVMNLYVNPSVNDTTVVTICSDDLPYVWNGITVTAGGVAVASVPGLTSMGCDSSSYLTLIVNPVVNTTINDTICGGGTYTFNGTPLTSSGTYYDTFSTSLSCDSIITLNLFVRPIDSVTIADTFCTGYTYTFFGTPVTTSGTYNYLNTAGSCDTFWTLNVLFNDTLRTYDTQTICTGGSFTWAGTPYATAGTYPIYGSTAAGCDTVHYLTINVNPLITDTTTTAVCAGGTYSFHGSGFTTAGTHTVMETTGACDTLFVLNLSITDTIRTYDTQTICTGGSFTWAGTPYATAGTYPIYGSTAAGCDTVHYLTINVNPLTTDTTTAAVCAGGTYSFHGSGFTTAGTHTVMETTGACDTLFVLNLSITDTLRTYDTQTICTGGSFTWAGTPYATAGTYPIYGSTAAGCDTVHYLTINVNPLTTDTTTAAVCAGGTYSFHGSGFTTAGTHTVMETTGACDTLFVLNLSITDTLRTYDTQTICTGGSFTWAGTPYATAGTYPIYGSTAAGCDTVHYLTINVNPLTTDTTTAAVCAGGTYMFHGSGFTTAGTHTVMETTGACDTLFVLNLSITDTIRTYDTQTICTGGSFVWAGTSYSTAGSYDLYGVNASGCDTVHYLTINVDPLTTDTTTAAVCAGGTYSFHGSGFTTAGTHTVMETTGACDTLFVLNLSITDTIRTYDTQTICTGGSFVWGGTTYTTAGSYDLYGVNASGCDTVHYLTINVDPMATDTTTAAVCAGGTYSFHGTGYTSAGTYSITETTGACDTLFVLNLSITDTIRTYDTQTICTGGSFVWAGTSYTTAGSYDLYGVSASGCDTVHYLTINVDPMATDTTTAAVCAGGTYSFHGTGYTSAGTYSITETTGACDTLFVLNLSITDTIRTYDTQTICTGGSFVWAGTSYTTAGSYDLYGVSASGCDTVHYLTINVDPLTTDTTTAAVCAGGTYSFHGTGYTSAGTYSITETSGACDTLFVLNLSITDTIRTYDTQTICTGGSFVWGGTTYTTAGSYDLYGVNASGCDTVHYLTINVDPLTTDTTTAAVCAGGTYSFHGTGYTSAGTYSITETSGACDTLFVLNLSITDTIRTYDTQTICTGGSFVWAGTSYTTAGSYDLYGVSASGCDTVHYLTIIVDPLTTDTTTAAVCAGGTYSFHGSGFTTAGTHTVMETTGACDTLFVLNLSITDTIRTYDTQTICTGGSFVWAGTSYTTAGSYDLYGVNASGCDTVHYLTINVDPLTTDTTTAAVCAGGTYSFHGTGYTSAGTYSITETSGACDTLFVLNLSITDTIRTYDTQTICTGGSFVWGGTSYTTAGTYLLYGTTAAGCDTLHTLTINLAPTITDTSLVAVCSGGSYTFFGSTYATAGTYTHLATGTGCDTLHVLNLSFNDTIRTYDTQSICTGGSFVWGGTSYTTAGTYPLYGATAAGCDTLHYLTITISPVVTDTIPGVVCSGGSYPFYGSSYSTAGTYTHLSTGSGCDTLHVLTLTIADTIRSYDTTAICTGGAYEWSGVSYTAAGTYPLYGTTAAGCDTIFYLTITVNPILTDTANVSICSGGSYIFGGVSYSTAGTYSYIGSSGSCDTFHVLNLSVMDTIRDSSVVSICSGGSITIGSSTLSTAGFYPFYYTTAAGCDSIQVVQIMINPVITDTTNATICDNETYTFYGSTYDSVGVYTYLDVSGACDTLRVLNLGVSPTLISYQDVTFCSNDLPTTYLGITIPYGTPSTAAYDSVVLTSVMGCDSTVIINLYVNDTSRSDIDTVLCFGATMTYGGVVISSPGVYYATWMNAVNCDSVVALHVTYTQPPSLQDTFVQDCGVVVYNGTTYTTSTSFIDTFRSIIGCDSVYRTVEIDVLYEPHDTFFVSLCQGESYNFNGTIYNTSTVATQTYVYDNGCDSTITMVLTVHDLPNVKLNYTTMEDELDQLCVLDSVTLHASGGLNYMYYNSVNEYLGTGDGVDVIVPNLDNQFYVIGYNEYGCADTGKLSIATQACCDVLMPNAFSPNGDGVNDLFGPVTFGNPENYHLVIFNRYGEKIFESFHIDDRWNGLYTDGKQADVGAYFYVLTGVCFDGTKLNMKGDVNLVR